MFVMSASLLDDALLKCVVSEVVLFSVVAFKTLAYKKCANFLGHSVYGVATLSCKMENIQNCYKQHRKLKYSRKNHKVNFVCV